MEQPDLSFMDAVLLLGIAQCLYVIVYLLFRSGRISRGGVPLVYFSTLGSAFTLTFLESTLPGMFAGYDQLRWWLWSLQPPLCVLLIIQVAQIYRTPSIGQYWVLLTVPLAAMAAYWGVGALYACPEPRLCEPYADWRRLAALFAGAISFLSLGINHEILASLPAQKNHKERYWLIIVLFFTNVAYLATMLVNIGLGESGGDFAFITIIYSLVLVYLGGTSLFRIYPQAVRIVEFTREKPKLSIYETSIAEQIEDLVYVQKVHHEPTYSRADMARECEAPEAVISRVVSQHFGQSFPQLLNQRRVEDAKHLLQDTQEAMTVIAREAGFNSLASFNRVFKEFTGVSPSEYRKKSK